MNENILITKLEEILGITKQLKEPPKKNDGQLSLYDEFYALPPDVRQETIPPAGFYGTAQDYIIYLNAIEAAVQAQDRWNAASDDNSIPRPQGEQYPDPPALNQIRNRITGELIDTFHAPDLVPDGAVPQQIYPTGVDGMITTATTTTGAAITTVGLSNGVTISLPQPVYKIEDIDKLITLLTLWIDDRSVISKMEKMYKQWKELQKIK